MPCRRRTRRSSTSSTSSRSQSRSRRSRARCSRRRPNKIRTQDIQISRIRNTTRRLETKHIIPPPRPSSPPQAPKPNIAIRLQINQQARNSILANLVISARELTKDRAFAVLAQPRRCSCHTFCSDCRAYAGRVCPGAVAVEVLVHFVDQQRACGICGVG